MSGILGIAVGLAIGYWVLERAESNKANLRRVGRVIGWLIVTSSFVAAVCPVYSGATGTMCPFSGKGGWKGYRQPGAMPPMPEGMPGGKTK